MADCSSSSVQEGVHVLILPTCTYRSDVHVLILPTCTALLIRPPRQVAGSY